MPGLECRDQTKDLRRSDTSPKVLGPARGQAAVLGRYALGKSGDCMRPDNRYVASSARYVNSGEIFAMVIVLTAPWARLCSITVS